MGADLLIISIEEKHPDRTMEERYALIEYITAEEATRIFENAQQASFAELRPDDVADGLTELDHVKEKLRDGLDAITKQYRDVTWIEVGGTTVWLTGGTSWGDDPGESWDSFLFLAETDIL